MEMIAGFGGLALILSLYLLPTLVALAREHINVMAIFILNLFLGWTFLGWIAAFVWCFTVQTKRPQVVPGSSAIVTEEELI